MIRSAFLPIARVSPVVPRFRPVGPPAALFPALIALAAALAPARASLAADASPVTRPATSPAEEEGFRRGDAIRHVLLELIEQADQADGVWPERLPASRPSGGGSSGVPGLVYL